MVRFSDQSSARTREGSIINELQTAETCSWPKKKTRHFPTDQKSGVQRAETIRTVSSSSFFWNKRPVLQYLIGKEIVKATMIHQSPWKPFSFLSTSEYHPQINGIHLLTSQRHLHSSPSTKSLLILGQRLLMLQYIIGVDIYTHNEYYCL